MFGSPHHFSSRLSDWKIEQLGIYLLTISCGIHDTWVDENEGQSVCQLFRPDRLQKPDFPYQGLPKRIRIFGEFLIFLVDHIEIVSSDLASRCVIADMFGNRHKDSMIRIILYPLTNILSGFVS